MNDHVNGLPQSQEVSWQASTLRIGQFMSAEVNGSIFTVRHVDRGGDAFLAGALIDGVIRHTGLFSSLGKAKAYLRPYMGPWPNSENVTVNG